MNRFTLATLLALAAASAARAQDPPKPILVTIHLVAPERPVLRHRLLPELVEQKREDAYKIYAQADELLKSIQGKEAKVDFDRLEELCTETPLARLATLKLRPQLAPYDKVYALLERGARCEIYDNDTSDRIRAKGIAALLPEVQRQRDFARLVRVRCRLALADGDVEAALRDVRTGMALGRHVGQTPTLISLLVGLAIGNTFLAELDHIIAHPKCPNLYWPLTDLPQPFLSMRTAYEGERLWAYGTFPGLGRVLTDPDAAPMTEEEVRESVKVLTSLNGQNQLAERYLLGVNIRLKHELAKKALLEAGWRKDKLATMPHVQVALLHALLDYEKLYDELVKLQNLPYPEATKRVDQIEQELRARRGNRPTDAPAIPLVEQFLPAVSKVRQSVARTERKIAALRCVEALRLYAAKHGGKLPASLADIPEVPIPIDPLLGRPFEYRRVSERTAALTAQAPPKNSNSAYRLIYHLRLP